MVALNPVWAGEIWL